MPASSPYLAQEQAAAVLKDHNAVATLVSRRRRSLRCAAARPQPRPHSQATCEGKEATGTFYALPLAPFRLHDNELKIIFCWTKNYSLVIELKITCVDTVYFVGLTPTGNSQIQSR